MDHFLIILKKGDRKEREISLRYEIIIEVLFLGRNEPFFPTKRGDKFMVTMIYGHSDLWSSSS
jgi:hypothetical protein